MPIPPPLPESWPFKAREPLREPEMVDDCVLPGLTGIWSVFATEPLGGLPDAAPLDGLFGRGGLVGAGGYVLRPYRRGGAMRYFNKDAYLAVSRFKNEYDIHSVLWEAGFPTVEPIGYACRRRLWGFQGVFITRRAGARPWPETWENGDFHAQARQVAGLVKPLADLGLWSPDMNATNILVDSSGQMLALDWDKAKWALNYNLVERYWERLKRSMKKLGAPQSLIDSLQLELVGHHENKS